MQAGGNASVFKLLGPGGAEPTADGDAVVIGKQRITAEGGLIAFAIRQQ